MRVLYFHQYFTGRGGSGGTRSYEMARALIARGHRVKIICATHPMANTGLPQPFVKGRREGNIDGIDVVEFELGYSNYSSIARRAWVFLRYALACIGYALREDYDVLFATSTPLTVVLPGAAGRIFRRKPFVLEIRDLWPELPRALGMKNPLLLGAMGFLEWLGYRTATRCIGLSPGIVEGIRARRPGARPIAMVPNCSDTDLFRPTSHKELNLPGVRPTDFTAMFCGAHGIANGLEAVLDAAAELKKRGVEGIRIVLVGDGKSKPALQASANARGLDNVTFVKPLPKAQLAERLSEVHVGLMILKNVPAFYFGTSPNKFFDYLSAGLPVLCNYPGWVSELITQNDCGVAVPPDDPSRFADALIQLRAQGERLAAMGKNARHLAEDTFSRERLAALWVHELEAAR